MTSIISESSIQALSNLLAYYNTNLLSIIITLLQNSSYTNHECAQDLIFNSQIILSLFLNNINSCSEVLQWALLITTDKCTKEIEFVSDVILGGHFTTTSNKTAQINTFSMESLAQTYKTYSPSMFHLLTALLALNRRLAGKHSSATLST
jgi:hypothetical protein